LITILAAGMLTAQEVEDRTLLSHEQMTAIVNEASGERAMHHVLELVPYQRVRPPEEYQGPYRESRVMADMARDYGFSNVSIEVYQSGGTAWQPTRGELWMNTPSVNTKLYDIYDIPLSLASLNANGDISGELVDVGNGQDFSDIDVAGKFVLASGNLRGAYTQAVQRGALGALAISAIGAERIVDYPDQIVSTSVSVSDPETAAWALTPETYASLQTRLARGETVTIRSIVDSVEVPSKAEYVHAEIPGDGSTTQEVGISAHLYEGVIKQGANDDNSGCALTLEIGRAYIKLINEGLLPPPKRTINFQWVPEISGTNAYLNAHPDKAANIIADLNFDMEGIRLTASRSFWILQRTPDTFPSFLNDIAQSMMEYVAEVSRERVRFRANGYRPVQPIVSESGSDDAFYIKIDKHYGSSDHVTYMQHGIPAVMFITWPDMWYHSSQDTPDKQDPTQYKRAAVVGTGALAVIATGGDSMAGRVVADNLGRGLSRMGESHTKGLGYMADVTAGGNLRDAYREARVAILHQAMVEKGVVNSAAVLFDDPAAGAQKTAAFAPLIDKRADALLDEVYAMYQLEAQRLGVTPGPVVPALTAAEQEAADLVVEQVPRTGGGRGGRGGGRGGGGPSIPQHMNAELRLLLGRNMTVLEIRDFLAGEFDPLPLADLMAVLRAQEEQGSIRLVPRQ